MRAGLLRSHGGRTAGQLQSRPPRAMVLDGLHRGEGLLQHVDRLVEPPELGQREDHTRDMMGTSLGPARRSTIRSPVSAAFSRKTSTARRSSPTAW